MNILLFLFYCLVIIIIYTKLNSSEHLITQKKPIIRKLYNFYTKQTDKTYNIVSLTCHLKKDEKTKYLFMQLNKLELGNLGGSKCSLCSYPINGTDIEFLPVLVNIENVITTDCQNEKEAECLNSNIIENKCTNNNCLSSNENCLQYASYYCNTSPTLEISDPKTLSKSLAHNRNFNIKNSELQLGFNNSIDGATGCTIQMTDEVMINKKINKIRTNLIYIEYYNSIDKSITPSICITSTDYSTTNYNTNIFYFEQLDDKFEFYIYIKKKDNSRLYLGKKKDYDNCIVSALDNDKVGYCEVDIVCKQKFMFLDLYEKRNDENVLIFKPTYVRRN